MLEMNTTADWMNVIASMCSCITMILHLPQLYKTCMTRDVSAFERRTIMLRILNATLWMAYGVLGESYPVVVSGAVGWTCEASLLCMTYRFARPTLTVQDAV